MKIELSREEVAELVLTKIAAFIPNAADYDIHVEPGDRYSSNSGGLEIILTPKEKG